MQHQLFSFNPYRIKGLDLFAEIAALKGSEIFNRRLPRFVLIQSRRMLLLPILVQRRAFDFSIGIPEERERGFNGAKCKRLI